MPNVTVKWARNTADVLNSDGATWTNVEVLEDDGEIEIRRGDDLVARFGRYDADVFVVTD